VSPFGGGAFVHATLPPVPEELPPVVAPPFADPPLPFEPEVPPFVEGMPPFDEPAIDDAPPTGLFPVPT
jgi:hypothetical protein